MLLLHIIIITIIIIITSVKRVLSSFYAVYFGYVHAFIVLLLCATMYKVRVINSTSTYCMGRVDFILFTKCNHHPKAVYFGCLHAINFIAMVYGNFVFYLFSYNFYF
jgi:hypothetical protein